MVLNANHRTKILYVEDDLLDQMAFERAIKSGVIDCEYIIVDSVNDAQDVLKEIVFDIILTDYKLGDGTGFDILDTVQHTPIIFLTALGGEETAVNALKAGAYDYLVKTNNHSHLQLLALTIHSVLKRKNAEELLRLTEFERSVAGMFRVRLDGQFVECNQTFVDIIRKPLHEIVQTDWQSIFDEDIQVIKDNLIHEKFIINREMKLKGKDADVFALVNLALIDTDDEKASFIAGMCVDITKRRQSENSLQSAITHLEILQLIDRAILEAHSIEEIAKVAIQYFPLLVNCHCASVITIDKETNTGIIRAVTSDIQESLTDRSILFAPHEIADFQQQSSVIINIDDYQKDGLVFNIFAYDTVNRLLITPLFAQNELIGIFVLGYTSQDIIGENYYQISQEIARPIAIGIRQTRLIQKVALHAFELEQRVKERTAELAKANHELSHEILERRQAEAEIQKSEEKYRTLIEFASDSIVIINDSGHIVLTNNQAQQFIGYEQQELIGQSIEILLPEHLYDSHIAHRTGYMTAPASHLMGEESDLVILHKNGTEIPVTISLSPIQINEERLVMAYIIDVTVERQLEQSLRAALAKEQEVNELKSEFVSMVSHEFKTPLAVILSSVSILENYSDRLSEEKKQKQFTLITRQIHRLTKLLNDTLTVTREDMLGSDFNPASLDLAELCETIAQEVTLMCEETHQIAFSVSSDCGTALIDENLLRHTLNNLLSNAVKYSPDGGTVYFDLICGSEEVTIRIKDEGIGIPKADQKRLFECFHRASNVGNISGTGLGLLIAKRSIESHGGTIGFESEEGAGTTFIITLPL